MRLIIATRNNTDDTRIKTIKIARKKKKKKNRKENSVKKKDKTKSHPGNLGQSQEKKTKERN